MSVYTTELRFICESLAGERKSVGYNDTADVIEKSWNKIFSFDFPIFEESYRKILCTKIIKHFYTREIGLETYGLWKLKLDERMNLIMPYYNQLYRMWRQDINYLADVDLTRTHNLKHNTNNTNTETSQSKSKGDNLNMYSDTPQGSVKHLEDGTYLTNATKNISQGVIDDVRENKGVINSIDDFVEHVVGRSGGKSYAQSLDEFKNALLNIDMMVIKDLENLFMLIW